MTFDHIVPAVKPMIVVEISFVEWTRDGLLRHSEFVGVRDDKSPREIRPRGGLTKREVERARQRAITTINRARQAHVATYTLRHRKLQRLTGPRLSGT
jgi:ATP-dependent DNA ligase